MLRPPYVGLPRRLSRTSWGWVPVGENPSQLGFAVGGWVQAERAAQGQGQGGQARISKALVERRRRGARVHAQALRISAGPARTPDSSTHSPSRQATHLTVCSDCLDTPCAPPLPRKQTTTNHLPAKLALPSAAARRPENVGAHGPVAPLLQHQHQQCLLVFAHAQPPLPGNIAPRRGGPRHGRAAAARSRRLRRQRPEAPDGRRQVRTCGGMTCHMTAACDTARRRGGVRCRT